MNTGGKHGPIQGMGYGLCMGEFTYFPNGTSDPSLTAITGGLARWIQSITYSATGVQTIVFKPGFGFAQTPRFLFTPNAASLAATFSVSQIGAYDATTRTLVLQQHWMQTTTPTGVAVAANAGCFVTVTVIASDTQGK